MHAHSIRTPQGLAAALLLAAGVASSAGVIYIDGPRSLAALEKSNPAHYARAERIIAAANELCKPGPLDAYFASFQAREISCADMVFKTSNPPKKQLSFTLDDTRYLALVTLPEPSARRVPLVR